MKNKFKISRGKQTNKQTLRSDISEENSIKKNPHLFSKLNKNLDNHDFKNQIKNIDIVTKKIEEMSVQFQSNEMKKFLSEKNRKIKGDRDQKNKNFFKRFSLEYNKGIIEKMIKNNEMETLRMVRALRSVDKSNKSLNSVKSVKSIKSLNSLKSFHSNKSLKSFITANLDYRNESDAEKYNSKNNSLQAENFKDYEREREHFLSNTARSNFNSRLISNVPSKLNSRDASFCADNININHTEIKFKKPPTLKKKKLILDRKEIFPHPQKFRLNFYNLQYKNNSIEREKEKEDNSRCNSNKIINLTIFNSNNCSSNTTLNHTNIITNNYTCSNSRNYTNNSNNSNLYSRNKINNSVSSTPRMGGTNNIKINKNYIEYIQKKTPYGYVSPLNEIKIENNFIADPYPLKIHNKKIKTRNLPIHIGNLTKSTNNFKICNRSNLHSKDSNKQYIKREQDGCINRDLINGKVTCRYEKKTENQSLIKTNEKITIFEKNLDKIATANMIHETNRSRRANTTDTTASSFYKSPNVCVNNNLFPCLKKIIKN